MPWHLVDLYFDYPQPVPFHSLGAGVTINGVPEIHQNLFVAVAFGHIGGSGFYFGLQTDLQDDRSGSDAGPGVLFSRWGVAEPGDARPAAGGGGWSAALTGAQSGEGGFVGVRLPYRWGAGGYDFQLVRRPSADGRGWWADLRMYDRGAHTWIDAGGLRFPDGADTVATSLVSFVELYGRPPTRDFPDDYAPPPLIVRFAAPEPAAGGGQPIRVTAFTDAGIPRWALSRWAGGGVTVTVDRAEPVGVAVPAPAAAARAVLFGGARRPQAPAPGP